MPLMSNDDPRWAAVLAHDRKQDGRFFYAVRTTGVYCRPSCPSRRPRRDNVRFFATAEEAERAGFRPCLRCQPLAVRPGDARAASVERICRYIEEHLDEPVRLGALGRRFGMSPFHLQRTFKSVLGITPREYAETCRMRSLKNGLHSGRNVTEAMHEAGYGSTSRLYEKTDGQLGMTPSLYRLGANKITIRYATVNSPLGRLLVAATDKGICSIAFGDSEASLLKGLRKEYPKAQFKRAEVVLHRWIGALLQQMYGEPADTPLPLDIRATAFQRRVWQHLRSIPFGSTRSYSEVARDIGEPSATRAVARACATNPVAIAIPCHRVVRSDGGLGGYRWGIERKKQLLEREAEARS
ncbi:MAG TPA: bifunctional DNA-binding transcriptional regulator/O6-methylguanine-DNA methyltransferase Ada [Terriglobales bacterium]|nr:bifunctional DNA-binding transcriptional regulator/O6-methylguanine-DNA methyltransferase Ada [Terriglobales bacterium]